MAHNVETMAYNKREVPWHGLGVPVEGDLTPIQMMDKAGLNWTVEKRATFINTGKGLKKTGSHVLYRPCDESILAPYVSEEWCEVQNLEAFEFFDEWVKAGHCDMETAGSLDSGRTVFALARTNESFELFNGKDKVDDYILFSNYHKYGFSTSVSQTAIRVVCQNTHNLALKGVKGSKIVKVSHRNKFDADSVKATIGEVRNNFVDYKEKAEFLSTQKAASEDVVTYFKRIFPVLSSKAKDDQKEVSLGAKRCLETLETQPGADIAVGTWWNAYNSVTHYLDHSAGRSADTRLQSSWYGAGKDRKADALTMALEMAR